MSNIRMELSDRDLLMNMDWDPSYLRLLFKDDFNDNSNLWHSNVCDDELVKECVRVEHEPYCPITEDISLDDSTLCRAVEQIEEE